MRLSSAVSRLTEAGIDEARAEARILFSRIGKINECELLFDPECDSAELDSAIEARARRTPLAYILGEADFYRENYIVTPDCLIPRPETELLVDYAVHHIPSGARFADICTGSGCIAISTLKNTGDTTAIALDLSIGALEVALPSIIAILLIAMFFQAFKDNIYVEKIFMGIRPAVVALIAAPCFSMARTAKINRYNIWIPVVAALLICAFGVSPIWVILAAGIGGFIYGRIK